MPIFAYFVVAGSVMIALLFFMGAPPEKGTRRAMVISDVQSLQMPWRPDRKQVLSDAVPAPAPDMTSPLVLAAQPKDQSPSEVLAKSAATDQKQMAARHSREALAARAEAPPTKKRVTRTQPPVEYRQNSAPPQGREFGLSGTNDFLSLSRTNGEPSVYNRGYAASREQAMRYFKARYIGPSN